jgi:HAD superfamily hydrolase (TIGR01509 family)
MKPLSKLEIGEYKLATSDLDGTLIDSGHFWKIADARVIERLLGEREGFISPEFIRTVFDKHKDIAQYFAELSRIYGVPSESIRAGEDDYSREFYRNVQSKPNAEKAIELIKKRGLMQAVVSDIPNESWVELQRNTTQKINFADFDTTVTLCDLGGKNKKPDPAGYALALSRLGIKGRDAIAFEDTESGIRAALANDMQTVNVVDKSAAAEQCKINKLTTFQIFGYDELINQIEGKGK